MTRIDDTTAVDAHATPRAEAPPPVLHVACLCAAWCRLCDDYGPVFTAAVTELQALHPGLRAHWIDIEDEAALLGDLDIETFPSIVVADAAGPRFAGAITPQPETLRRVLRAALQSPQPGAAGAGGQAEVCAFAQRLVQRA